MFGESRSGESPRLPSPWHQALASSKHFTITQEPAASLRGSPYLGGRSVSDGSSRTPSSLSLRADGTGYRSDPDDDGDFAADGSRGEGPQSGSVSTMDSSNESSDMPSWRRSSQNLVIPPNAIGLTKLPAESDTVGQIEYKVGPVRNHVGA